MPDNPCSTFDAAVTRMDEHEYLDRAFWTAARDIREAASFWRLWWGPNGFIHAAIDLQSERIARWAEECLHVAKIRERHASA